MDRGSLPGMGFWFEWQVSALNKEWRCSAHVQAPAWVEDCPPSSWELVNELSGPAGLSFLIFILGKTREISPHPPSAQLVGSAHKEDSRAGKRNTSTGAACLPSPAVSLAHHLQGADNSHRSRVLGLLKAAAGVFLRHWLGGYCFSGHAEFLLPGAPGRNQSLGSRSALVRAAHPRCTCVTTAPQRVLSRFLSELGFSSAHSTSHKQSLPSLLEKSSALFRQHEKCSPSIKHARADAWPFRAPFTPLLSS